MALVVLLRMYVPTNSIMKDITVLTSVIGEVCFVAVFAGRLVVLRVG